MLPARFRPKSEKEPKKALQKDESEKVKSNFGIGTINFIFKSKNAPVNV